MGKHEKATENPGNGVDTDVESDAETETNNTETETASEPNADDKYARRLRQLHTELVRATGRLADPTDLEFAEEHLDDPDKLTAAIDALLTKKPHLKKPRKPAGNVGAGEHGNAAVPTDFSQLFQR